ncbi:hypothetical protein [Phenylobacterium sp.]|uniref:hypothetical protein n=1 Tax=Phenylobacterium sp. TaxID=1871053 RepID=UPI002CFDB730|nr:hypothetical protein [Phenylobacterium sp.]HLZ77174.1 hypothetical protein [Phenylobacterium sp.]
MSVRPLSALELAGGAAIALVCALTGAVALMSLAKPGHFDTRMAAVERDAGLAAKLLRQRTPTQGLTADATCSSALPAEAERLRAQLFALASVFPLQNVSIEVTQEPQARLGVLAPLRLRLSGAGSYEAALTALGRLGAVRPLVFIDSVDLSSKTSFVTFSISGRVFCSASR